MTRPIPHRALYEEVAERLRQLIYGGELAPGTWIDERALVERFGTSRTPLREALKVLHAEGLVRLTPAPRLVRRRASSRRRTSTRSSRSWRCSRACAPARRSARRRPTTCGGSTRSTSGSSAARPRATWTGTTS